MNLTTLPNIFLFSEDKDDDDDDDADDDHINNGDSIQAHSSSTRFISILFSMRHGGTD